MNYHTYSIRNAIYDFINGIWSGMPLCCTRYYIQRSFGLRGKLMRIADLGPIGKVAVCTWGIVEEERAGISFEEINKCQMQMLKDGSEEQFNKENPGYTQCDKCYENKYTVEIKHNGTIGRWIIQ